MASLLHADLPSEDEEDDSYDPTTDKTAEPEDRLGKPKRKPESHSRRGLAVGTSAAEGCAPVQIVTAVDLKRKANAASLFEALRKTSHQAQARSSVRPAPVSLKQQPTSQSAAPRRKRSATDQDTLWMRSLGLAPPTKCSRSAADIAAAVLSGSTTMPRVRIVDHAREPAEELLYSEAQGGGQEGNGAAVTADVPHAADSSGAPLGGAGIDAGALRDAQVGPGASETEAGGGQVEAQVDRSAAVAAIAAAALASAPAAISADAARRAGLVTISETRRFAGQDVKMARELKAGSKEAAAAAAKAAAGDTGLDAVLNQITGPRKANVMDKSRDDWSGFKQTNQDMHEELEASKKSGATYLAKKAFLQQAELVEYEKERDARLGADMRSRGRL